MKKIIQFASCFILLIFNNAAFGQDIMEKEAIRQSKKDTRILNIVSLDGKNQKVKIVPDYLNKILRIICLKDTINISDFWGVPPEVPVLNKTFIKIDYEVRGGSNFATGNTLIICINKGKLFEAAHILRYAIGDSGEITSKYNVRLTLKGNSSANYKLVAKVYDDHHSLSNPESDFMYDNQTILKFDKVKNAFYSIKENVYNRVAVTNGLKKEREKISGNLLVILLGEEKYYFFSNKWYQASDSGVYRAYDIRNMYEFY